MISPQRRREIIDALRRGTVPIRSLDAFAVGMEKFQSTIDDELETVRAGASAFKAVRGEYGSGKTFFSRWIANKAQQRSFATAEVQISETETPLHKLETVYRRAMEKLSTSDTDQAAFRNIINGWFYTLEEDLIAANKANSDDGEKLIKLTDELMEQRLSSITRIAPAFAAALRGYRKAETKGDASTANGLIAWLCGQPNIAANVKRIAGIKGEVDHFGALNFLQGLLTILRDSGYAGLVLILDEVETLQRVRGDMREKGLNSLRQLIDETDSGRFPGLYLLITGTPSFYDSPMGIHKLPPLAQRLHVDFTLDSKFDNPRAVQIRLPGFSIDSLVEVGIKIRDIFASNSLNSHRILTVANQEYIELLARNIAGNFGNKVGIAPRIFLKKLVGEVLDRIEQFDDFDPLRDYKLTIQTTELSEVERNALTPNSVNDIDIEV